LQGASVNSMHVSFSVLEYVMFDGEINCASIY